MSNIKFYEVPNRGIFIRTWNKPILMEVFEQILKVITTLSLIETSEKGKL